MDFLVTHISSTNLFVYSYIVFQVQLHFKCNVQPIVIILANEATYTKSMLVEVGTYYDLTYLNKPNTAFAEAVQRSLAGGEEIEVGTVFRFIHVT